MRNVCMVSMALAAVALAGCELEQACTDIAVSSVSLDLVDEAGLPIAGADVTYMVDGADPVACEEFADGEWTCGWEVAGTLQINADAVGYAPGSVEVEVASDECHVITEVVELELLALNCTDEEVPAVMVDVLDTQGTEITAATVTWGLANADMAPQPCAELMGNQWACAPEQSGGIEISVTEAGPYEPYFAVVPVEHDGCHPIQVAHEAVLSFLPD